MAIISNIKQYRGNKMNNWSHARPLFRIGPSLPCSQRVAPKALQVQIISMRSFKEQYDLAKRRDIYEKSTKLHPSKIAVVVEAHPRSKLPINRYFKFMAGDTYTASSIQEIIKKELMRTSQISKNDTTAIYLFCKNKLLKASDLLKDLENDRDLQDKFLYLMIAETEAF